MRTILTVDTSTNINTVAVCRGGEGISFTVLAETVVGCRRLHSERLLTTVDWVFSEAGLTWGDIDSLAVSIGPGSFTGLRIGAATWKGLAFARDLPLVAVPTLDAMTRALPISEGVACMLLDARMKEVFGAVYHWKGGVRSKAGADRVCPVEALLEGLSGKVMVLGDGVEAYAERIRQCLPEAQFLPGWHVAPRASFVAAEALDLMAFGVDMDPALVSPVYLRLSQAEVNRARAKGSGAESAEI